MTRRLLITSVVVALVPVPATAHAATLVNAGGTLTYTAGAGTTAALRLSDDWPSLTTIVASRDHGDDDAITFTGCVERTTYPAGLVCEGVSRVVVALGAGDDSVWAHSLTAPLSIDGGPGNDDLTGGRGMDGLAGGAGDDSLHTTAGGDTVSGGSGIDTVFSHWAVAGPFAVSLDGAANDGSAGDGANILPDVEDIYGDYPPPLEGLGGTDAPLTLTGSDAGNRILGSRGPDHITGAGGGDTLIGNGGDDTLDARDGVPDRVSCGLGNDSAVVDPRDLVAASCENVQVADVGNGLEDKPPTIAWAAPVPSARLSPTRTTELQVTPADDRGVTSVRFLDDDRVVCTDTAAPFTCAYGPREQDVGRNTLVAIATDAGGQTAGAVRLVEVARFSVSSVSLQVSRRGNRYTATGKVTLPAGVRCSGTVAVRGGGVTRRDRLDRSCRYRISMTARLGARLQATFLGTETVAPARSKVRGRTR